jgi:2-keto-4-pentenoate hydratase
MTDVKDIAAQLVQAEQDRSAIAPFSDADPGISVQEAYAAQWAVVQSKLDAGETLIGVKLGLTSRAKQEAMGVAEPLHGWITSGMVAGAGEPIDRQSLIQPRAEPEIAFLLGRDVTAPATITSVLAATEAVFAAVDILDSRYRDYRFTLPDVIADNASAGRVVLGPQARRPAELIDLRLGKIAAACARARRPLRGQDKIAVRADRVLKRRKVARHFTVEITGDSIGYARDQDSIAAEAKLDGIYVLRTSVAAGDLDSPAVISSYKALAQVERVFRALNTDLDIRPIRHRTQDRVRAHVFLRMISYYITWHMQARLAPLLFTDDDKQTAQAARTSPVAPAARSPRARAKAATKQTPGDLPVHSFATLLADLATICLNTIAPADPALPRFRLVTTPTVLQRQAFELLGVSHRLGVP